jgi:hypothetical protein
VDREGLFAGRRLVAVVEVVDELLHADAVGFGQIPAAKV